VTEHFVEGLRINVDDETGLVLHVSADLPHGRVELRVERLVADWTALQRAGRIGVTRRPAATCTGIPPRTWSRIGLK
jgi:hypothetical protein